MTTPVWQPGTLYAPGSLVRPASAPPVQSSPPTNPGFESGDTGWTKDTGWTIGIETGDRKFAGDWSAQFDAASSPATGRIVNNNHVPVVAGLSITAKCQVQQGASSAGQAGARVQIDWLDSNEVLLSTSDGNLVDSGSGGAWHQSTVTATAPNGAAFARVAAFGFRLTGGDELWVDQFSWNYAFQPAISGLIFRAVQADAGFSAATEPTWPTVLGVQVVDNEVIWEAVDTSLVTWEANPILVSGYDEPVFPEFPGATVADNTIIWVAVTRRVEDERCPNTPIVAIGASKIFCADEDIIAFSATVNPLDWSTTEDAGYLPFGLQTYGSNPVAALGLYRSNLIAFNSEGFQMWQIDQDPANMAFLDASPVGCTEARTLAPVQNDLVFLTAVGIRNIGIAGASTNLQAGTFGEAIDPLVLTAIRAQEFTPHAVFIPAYGQYWLFFGDEAFVLTITDVKRMSWSRYVFPEEITDATLLGNDLYLRTATGKVWKVDDQEVVDDCVGGTTSALMFGYASPSGENAGVRYVDPEGGTTADRSITVGIGFAYPSALAAIGETWFAVAQRVGSTTRIYRSTDAGVTWTGVHTFAGAEDFWGLAYDGDQTLVVIGNTTGTPIVSVDGGATWTEQTPVASFFPDYVVYAPSAGLFVAADDSSCYTSPDGVTWTERTVPFGGEVAASPNYVIIWNSEDVNHRVAYSTDGITWNSADTGLEVLQFVESESIAYNTDLDHWIVNENERILTTNGGVDPADPSADWTTFNWPAGTANLGNQTAVAYAPGVGSVYTIQDDDGSDLVYLNSDDTFANWQLITDLGALSATGLFVSSFSYTSSTCVGTEFESIIHWPYLDFGMLGTEKQFVGFDLVADAPEGVRVSIGYDQRDRDARTTDYEMDADSLPGKLVPISISGPSFDVRLTFNGGQAWEWQAANIYINDRRTGS